MILTNQRLGARRGTHVTFTAYPMAVISSRTASAVAQSLLSLAASRLSSNSARPSGQLSSPASSRISNPGGW